MTKMNPPLKFQPIKSLGLFLSPQLSSTSPGDLLLCYHLKGCNVCVLCWKIKDFDYFNNYDLNSIRNFFILEYEEIDALTSRIVFSNSRIKSLDRVFII